VCKVKNFFLKQQIFSSFFAKYFYKKYRFALTALKTVGKKSFAVIGKTLFTVKINLFGDKF